MTFAAFALVLASVSSAQTLQGPAAAELARAAEGPAQTAALADGSKTGKTDSDGTLVVSERRNVDLGLHKVSGGSDCAEMGADVDGRHRGGHCAHMPSYTERSYADVQTVKIVDRGAYNTRQGLKGAAIGGAIGLLGLFALFAGPIGWAVAAVTVVAGAAIGYAVGRKVGADTPDTFKREVNERSVRQS